MTETSCARCDVRAESQWRIDLEKENESRTERTRHHVCQNCWDDFCDRFTGTTP